MRLFTAIELPEALRTRLARAGTTLVEQEWGMHARSHHITFTREQNLHVTVKFLGEIPDANVAAVCDMLRAAVPRVGELSLNVDGLEMFPPRGPVRVIAAKVGGNVEALSDVQRAIEDAVVELGVARETRPYRPHVTLARCKRGLPDYFRSSDIGVFKPDAWLADAVVLMESRLHPTAPEYFPVARFALQ